MITALHAHNLNLNDIVRYRIRHGGLFGGQVGICRISKFSMVPEHKGLGWPVFRAGDWLIQIIPIREGKEVPDLEIRFQPGEIEFAALESKSDSDFVIYHQPGTVFFHDEARATQ